MSLRVFSLLSVYGEQLFVDYLQQVHQLSDHCAQRIINNPDLELVTMPDTNIVCFRYHPRSAGLSADVLNHLNTMIRSQLRAAGEFYVVQTKLREQTWMRCTFTNPLTRPEDIDEMLEQVMQAGQSLVEWRSSFPG